MNIKHAIFDLDGTLTDSNGVWFDAVFEYIDNHCSFSRRDLPPEFENEIIFGGTYEALEYLKKNMGDTRELDEVRSIIMSTVEKLYNEERNKKPGALEFLKKLKTLGADVCVVTATPSPLAEKALRLSGLLPYTDFIISAEERKSGKEKPYIFLEAASRMNCETCECTLFEDALYSIRTGLGLGMTAVGVEDAYCTEAVRREICGLCNLYIRDYSEIKI